MNEFHPLLPSSLFGSVTINVSPLVIAFSPNTSITLQSLQWQVQVLHLRSYYVCLIQTIKLFKDCPQLFLWYLFPLLKIQYDSFFCHLCLNPNLCIRIAIRHRISQDIVKYSLPAYLHLHKLPYPQPPQPH